MTYREGVPNSPLSVPGPDSVWRVFVLETGQRIGTVRGAGGVTEAIDMAVALYRVEREGLVAEVVS